VDKEPGLRLFQGASIIVVNLDSTNAYVCRPRKVYSPASRELKAILEDLRLHPAPTIVDIDMRDDVEVLKPALDRLTSMPEIPLLLIGGKVVGTMDEIKDMSKDGRLQKLLAEAGAVVNGQKKKKGRKH
jgi:glutaredoxin-related protein